MRSTHHPHTIHTPPPTAGGLTALQALGILKSVGQTKKQWEETAALQARLEALRIAWHDRLQWLGDPSHARVPIDRLLSEEYLADCGKRVMAAIRAKKPVEAATDGRPAGGTIHLNAVDSAGMMVALTLTHGNGFGAQVAVDGLGLVLGHGMSRFDPRPGRPNSPGPAKRPLHNMCPTIVTRNGEPIVALGATGGRKIVNTLFDALVYRVVESQPFAAMIRNSRIHTEGDLTLMLEKNWPSAIVDHLKKVGYAVKTGTGATLSAIERDPKSGALLAATR